MRYFTPGSHLVRDGMESVVVFQCRIGVRQRNSNAASETYLRHVIIARIANDGLTEATSHVLNEPAQLRKSICTSAIIADDDFSSTRTDHYTNGSHHGTRQKVQVDAAHP